MKVNINITGMDEVLDEALKLVDKETLAEANERMGEGVRVWMMNWYKQKSESAHFENPALPTHGAGRKKTGWANSIARSWLCEPRSDGARVYMGGQTAAGQDLASSLLMKIYGGTVEAKRAGALTIPLVPEAHGVRASVYEQVTGTRLFLLKNKLKGQAYLAAANGAGGVRAVYMLKKSQTFAPWPESFPAVEDIAETALFYFTGALLEDTDVE